MTYQEKQVFADEAVTRFNNGLNWVTFQRELEALPGFYQKDINSTNRAVLKALKREHGPRIGAALRADHANVDRGPLDDSVFQKVVDQEIDSLRTEYRNKITASVKAGNSLENAAKANHHALLTQSDIEIAGNRAKRQVKTAKSDKTMATVGAVLIGVIWLVVKLILRSAANN